MSPTDFPKLGSLMAEVDMMAIPTMFFDFITLHDFLMTVVCRAKSFLFKIVQNFWFVVYAAQ
jgi:hypothetical protein